MAGRNNGRNSNQVSPLSGSVSSLGTTYNTVTHLASPTPTDDSNCKEHKKLFRRLMNLLAVSIIAMMGMLIVIFGINSHLISNHQKITGIPNSEYLLLPVKSTIRLPVDKLTEYSAIDFSITETSVTPNITFILATDYSRMYFSDFIINARTCYPSNILTSKDCRIFRYWPFDYSPFRNSTVSCEYKTTPSEYKSWFLVWKWFPLQVLDHRSHIIDFPIDCESLSLHQYHKCTEQNIQLNVDDILDDRKDGDNIVVMTFCTNDMDEIDDSETISYSTEFYERRPNFATPYNQYPLYYIYEDFETIVTVPITNSDKHIDIVVTGGSNTDPVEIQLNRKASVTHLLDNDAEVYQGAICLIVFSIFLLFTDLILAVFTVWSYLKYRQ